LNYGRILFSNLSKVVSKVNEISLARCLIGDNSGGNGDIERINSGLHRDFYLIIKPF